jgi:anti-sigma factor RsiW
VGDLLQLRDAHGQAQMLLPWHVNGTLEPGEAEFVEAHLGECAECRADVAANRALRELYAAMPAPVERAPRALLNAVDGSSWRVVRRRLSSGWGKAAQLALASAAAVAVVTLVAPSPSEGPYRLLGSDERAAQGNAIVLFAPDTPERDLRAALDEAGARLVDGPTASGAYIVQVPAERRSSALEGLRALPQVVLAEPVDAAGGP